MQVYRGFIVSLATAFVTMVIYHILGILVGPVSNIFVFTVIHGVGATVIGFLFVNIFPLSAATIIIPNAILGLILALMLASTYGIQLSDLAGFTTVVTVPYILGGLGFYFGVTSTDENAQN